MRPMFGIDTRGTARLTICIGPWALKVARNATGRRCNRFEADLWARTTTRRRNMLCPVLARLPFGLWLLMQRAEPLPKDEHDQLIDADGFPDWDYVPPDETSPFEYKVSDWGRLPDGRLEDQRCHQSSAGAAKGEHAFAKCALCHAKDKRNGIGPGLLGIIGRHAGSVPGFRYS